MEAVIDGSFMRPAGSMVPWAQERLCEATRQALAAVASDVRLGLLETIGIESEWVEDKPCSVKLHLPDVIAPDYVARAVDLENVESWLDEQGCVRVAIGPWFTTKDVDQAILAVTKSCKDSLGLLGLI